MVSDKGTFDQTWCRQKRRVSPHPSSIPDGRLPTMRRSASGSTRPVSVAQVISLERPSLPKPVVRGGRSGKSVMRPNSVIQHTAVSARKLPSRHSGGKYAFRWLANGSSRACDCCPVLSAGSRSSACASWLALSSYCFCLLRCAGRPRSDPPGHQWFLALAG